MTAVCAECGPVSVVRSGPRRNVRCWEAVRQYNAKRNYSQKYAVSHARRLYLKDRCEACGFVAVDPCQLHIDHVDGDWKNDTPENWQTLCQNCHSLKSTNEKRARNPRPKAGVETRKDH